ncbi:DUF3578 domain-containing protein [Vibrio diazotrophicus]|uniref:DUF3578 domain-containing protein n=1 Tax=Vibrio diazotrophicus TaxID=685 RepID=A0A2J8I6K6_VIBDI|nr:DUF3578 domain-containing protein [Vibrio diazotrophicus]PNI06162.1 DUF3578 domain-containing protein [Vibrio diazotrophicus]
MKDLIIELANLWPSYFKRTHVDGTHRADRLINVELRNALQQINESFGFKQLLVDASSGEGNITRGPWFASFDTRVTTTATQGFYVVFLFSTDMKTLTLELGLGATQFTNFYGKNNRALQKIRNAAIKMQLYTIPILNRMGKTELLQRTSLEPSNLIDKRSYSLQRGYEEGAILHLNYEIDENLDLKALVEDYAEFIKIYQHMVEDNAIPSNEELLYISIHPDELSAKVDKIEVVDFTPRIPPKRNNGNGSKGNGNKGTSSTSTKKIGDWGEKIVLDREIKYLTENGRADLAEKVVHEEANNNRPGWDITSYNLDGTIRLIEVKSTVASSTSSLNLTANELDAAAKHGDSYYLYLLTSVTANGAKRIEKLQNPHKLINEGAIQAQPSVYEVKLYAQQEN